MRFISLEEYLPEQIALKKDLELDFSIEYDLEWLAILKATDFLFYQGMEAAAKKFNLESSTSTG